jgi:outer membrane receptor protein involved in Fe transport
MYFANADYHVPNPNGGGPQDVISFTGSVLNITETQPSAYIDTRYSYAAPRLGFVWRPTAAVAIRAAAGGGFAEAPLGDLVGSNESPNCFSGISCTETLTNVNLQPEKSFSFDLGTDIRLPRNTIASFDVYRSNLYGQLYNSTTTNGSCPICGGLPLYITEYGNLAESRYEGLLLDLHHDASHGIYWALSGGLTRGYVVSVPTGFYSDASGPCNHATATTPDGNPCPNLTVVPGVNFNGTFAASIPYAQGLGTLGYRWNAEKYADLVATYYGNNNTYFRPAFMELDGYIGYPIAKNISLLATFRNITGIYDGSTQILSPGIFSGAPTISGLPSVLYGEMYGPRTIILTTQIHL